MAETAGLALSAFGTVSAFITTFEAIFKLRGAYKLGRAFGDDYLDFERLMIVRWTRLKEIRDRPIQFLRGEIQYGHLEDGMAQAARFQLELIYKRFYECNGLMKRYNEKAAKARAETLALFEEPQKKKPWKGGKKRLSIAARKLANLSPQIRPISPTQTPSDSGTDTPPTIPHPPYFSEVVVETSSEGTGDASDPGNVQPRVEENMDQHLALMFSECLIPASALEKLKDSKDLGRQLRKATGIWALVRWTAEDRAELGGYLSDIREYLDELEGIVRLVSPDDPMASLDPYSTEADAHEIISNDVRETISNLHKTLQKTSSRSGEGKDVLAFAIQPVEDPAAQATEFALEYDSLPLHLPDSHLSILRCFPKEAEDKAAIVLYVQSARLSRDSRHNHAPIPEGTDLSAQLSDVRARTRSDADNVVSLGSLRQPGPSGEHLSHTISWSEKGPWIIKNTLSDILREDATVPARLRAPTQTLQLARIATLAFLYFLPVMKATGKYPRPENWLYFVLRVDAQDPLSVADAEALVLNPYFDIGLGHRPPRRDFSASSGLSKLEWHPVTELGLLLYQIGSGRPVEYGEPGPEGLSKALAKATGRMSEVDRRVGPSFSELVGLCLDRPSNFSGGMSGSDYQFLEKLRIQLRKAEGASLQV